jgi:hypothetical protein
MYIDGLKALIAMIGNNSSNFFYGYRILMIVLTKIVLKLFIKPENQNVESGVHLYLDSAYDCHAQSNGQRNRIERSIEIDLQQSTSSCNYQRNLGDCCWSRSFER